MRSASGSFTPSTYRIVPIRIADSRLAELDYLLNNDLADVDCENWEEDTPFKDPRELYDFKDGKARRGTCLFPRRPGRQQHLCERWQSKWLY